MAIDIYLNFDGNTREVVEFYAKVFGQETPQMMTFGDSGSDPNHPIPEEAKSRIMHTRLSIAGSTVMFSDLFPGMPHNPGNNFSLSVQSNSAEDLQSYFHQLKVDGNVIMELQQTFWSKLYGSLTDKFGIQWQFNLDSGEVWTETKPE